MERPKQDTMSNLDGQVEMHRSGRVGWLRAAVLGSDDAIVSTASLMIGVTAASASRGAILVAGVAGLVAGAMSMAVGEYVSVSSQRDAERADIERDKLELVGQPQAELQELAMIHCKRRGYPPQALRSSPWFRLQLFSSRQRHCVSP
jgi:VIT1/CCC1 family predicted Fe2+/Mn2+ transporter